MSITKQLMAAQSAAGPGIPVQVDPDLPCRAFVVSLGGVAGAVSAQVAIEVSCDNGVTWAARMSFTLTGASTLAAPITNSDVDSPSPFPLVRANVLSINGGGVVGVACSAAKHNSGA